VEARRNGYIAKGQGSARISSRSEADAALERTFVLARSRARSRWKLICVRICVCGPFNIAIQLTRRAYHVSIKNLRRAVRFTIDYCPVNPWENGYYNIPDSICYCTFRKRNHAIPIRKMCN